MKNFQKRRKVLINKRFQLTFLLKFILFYTFIITSFFLIMNLFIESEADAIAKSFVTNEDIKVKFRLIILTVSLISLVVSSVMLYFFVIILSHRISGPLHRFDLALKDLADRNLNTMVKLRKKDQLYGISDSFEVLKKELIDDFSEMKIICELKKNDPDIEISANMKKLIDIIDKYKI